ncbi:cytidine deaminase [Botrimarina hoheduenensis]|uniref:Cytidine deaminase n=1 Tax=Botrimarina hoheduenensis TaxID=2528000 RepID=A0A5C5WEI5_9BACT|nr:cytidine deaminase [Botrimarina hoheduenensis]TWT48907.1 Cytidine deaminase [Botrimarina hoheduenensis]
MNSPTPEQIETLIRAALDVRNNAYAPFSDFLVGAAVLDEQGRVFAGVNVENSSYGLTICAERSAAVTAISSGSKSIVATAVATDPVANPCGACRQFLYEFGPDMAIFLVNATTKELVTHTTLGVLLPGGFRLDR